MQRTFINFLFLLVFSFQSLAQIKTTDKNQMTDNRSVVAGEGRYAKLPLNFLYKNPPIILKRK